MHSFLFIFNAKNNNSRLQYRNSDFNMNEAVGQSYEYIHTGTYKNDKLKHNDANIHNTESYQICAVSAIIITDSYRDTILHN